ncbi:MAG TPA: hypothetical protein ENL03_04825 [Phycisphaerae bacterium]|nr:hypothetical protein [Phycisphaerae bacterium]
MIRRAEEPLSDEEYPDDIDLTDSESDEFTSAVAQCPLCKREIWEESPYCPHCRQWVTLPDSSLQNSRKLYVRFGLWGIKTILMNWIFWGAIPAIINFIWLIHYLLSR